MRLATKLILGLLTIHLTTACQNSAGTSDDNQLVGTNVASSEMENIENLENRIATAKKTNKSIDLTSPYVEAGDHICVVIQQGDEQPKARGVLTVNANSSFSAEYNGHYYIANHTSTTGIALSIRESNSSAPVNSKLLQLAQSDENGKVLIAGKFMSTCDKNGYCNAFEEKQTQLGREYKLIGTPNRTPIASNKPLNIAPQFKRQLFIAQKSGQTDTLLAMFAPTRNSRNPWSMVSLANFNSQVTSLIDGNLVFSCIEIRR